MKKHIALSTARMFIEPSTNYGMCARLTHSMYTRKLARIRHYTTRCTLVQCMYLQEWTVMYSRLSSEEYAMVSFTWPATAPGSVILKNKAERRGLAAVYCVSHNNII